MTGSRPKPCQIMIRGMLCLDTAPRQAQTFQKRDNTLWLLMTEIPRDLFSEIVIVRHPLCVCVPVNHTVTLSVRAEGTGVLNYQWFTEDEKEVCGSELFKWMTLVCCLLLLLFSSTVHAYAVHVCSGAQMSWSELLISVKPSVSIRG